MTQVSYNKSGNKYENYYYGPFGELMQGKHGAWGWRSDGSKSESFARIGYTGTQADIESSTYHFAFREYAPLTAQFTTEDPVKDGDGWYALCGMNAVNGIDPLGLNGKLHDGSCISKAPYEIATENARKQQEYENWLNGILAGPPSHNKDGSMVGPEDYLQDDAAWDYFFTYIWDKVPGYKNTDTHPHGAIELWFRRTYGPTPMRQMIESIGPHTILDALGFIPVVGEIADGVNALIYVIEGDFGGASLTAICIIPVAGDIIGKGGKVIKAADQITYTTKLLENATDAGTTSIKFIDDAGNTLKFRANDLVYGPSANARLRQLQQTAGGRLLNDIGGPAPGQSWTQFSIQTMENQVKAGGIIRFDLTNMSDISGVLKGTGQFGNTVTAAELRYIQQNWSRFSTNVKFYQNAAEVAAPW